MKRQIILGLRQRRKNDLKMNVEYFKKRRGIQIFRIVLVYVS